MQLKPKHKHSLKSLAWKIGALCPIDPKNCSSGVALCHQLQRCGIDTTLGKFSNDGDAPEQIVKEYLRCSNALKSQARQNSFYISIKPPAFQFDIEHVKKVALAALANGHGIHFDSHDHRLAESTLDLLKQLLTIVEKRQWGHADWLCGLTLPSRWKRSLYDAKWALKKGIRVRLVKGEFKAAAARDEINPNRGYLTLIDRLAGSIPEIGIATHDYGLAKKAIARARDNGSNVQLELLFGMPSARMVALSREMQVPLRFYVAYGDTLLLYGVRHHLTAPHKFFRPGFSELLVGRKSKLSKIFTSYHSRT